jgi:hypothetical protein
MTKNEIVAEFMDVPDSAAPYSDSYDCLMSAWVKFRDLKFSNYDLDAPHAQYCWTISQTIVLKSITEAFDALCRGIEWYNSLKK